MSEYHHLCLAEREEIYVGLQRGQNIQQIARVLGRSAATVSRDVRRNRDARLGYTADRADAKAKGRTRGRPKKKLREGTREHRWVMDGLAQAWSPEQIAGRYGLIHKGMTLSHETIYQFVYAKEQAGTGSIRSTIASAQHWATAPSTAPLSRHLQSEQGMARST